MDDRHVPLVVGGGVVKVAGTSPVYAETKQVGPFGYTAWKCDCRKSALIPSFCSGFHFLSDLV